MKLKKVCAGPRLLKVNSLENSQLSGISVIGRKDWFLKYRTCRQYPCSPCKGPSKVWYPKPQILCNIEAVVAVQKHVLRLLKIRKLVNVHPWLKGVILGLYRGDIRIKEKKMKTTIEGLRYPLIVRGACMILPKIGKVWRYDYHVTTLAPKSIYLDYSNYSIQIEPYPRVCAQESVLPSS